MDQETRERIADRLELMASLAWLFMDFSWMEQSAIASVLFAVPTTVCALAAVAFVRADFTARAVAGATAAWAVMNAIWMLSDLRIYEGRALGRACFVLGLTLLVLALWRSGTRPVLDELTRTFRRLRARRR
jgi:hypothetical protein